MGKWLKVKEIVATIFLLVFWSAFPEGFAAETNDVGSIKIHNVGQGNCITLEVKGKGEAASQYMLIDIGTSAYGREKKWERTHHTPPSSSESHGFSSGSHHTPLSSRVASAPAVPRTIERPRTLPSSLGTGGGKVGDEIFGEIRKALGAAKEGAPVHVKTIVITHPDEDHYGWLARLLSDKRNQVDNIILGGVAGKL